jgi:hypothetical protein
MDAESRMALALNGKFFWEPTTLPLEPDSPSVKAIRRAQRQHAKGAEQIVLARPAPINSIKPMTSKLGAHSEELVPVLKAISIAYDVSVDDLLGKSTSTFFTAAKSHLYWAIFRYLPKISYLEAGRMIRKSHTTVMHGRKLFEKNPNPDMIAKVDLLMGRAHGQR